MTDDGLGIPETKVPQVAISTEAQAITYVEGLIGEMGRLRAACDVPYAGNDVTTIQAIQRMMWAFLTKQGQVIGALNAFRMTGLMPERAYIAFHQKAINALAPTISH